VVFCYVIERMVIAWIFSTMRLMLFFDGRYPRRAWPVLAEYIRPKRISQEIELPVRNLADPCLILVHCQLQLAHDLAQSLQRRFGVALPAQNHEIVGVGHDASAEASLQPEHLPSQHEPAHVQIRQQW